MDLTTSAEYGAVAEVSRSLGLDLLSPAARDAERAAAVPDAVWTTLSGTGLTAPVPEDLGGCGVPDVMSQLVVVHNLAFGDAGIAMAALWHGSVLGLLAQHGTAEQQQQCSALVRDQHSRCGLGLYEGFGRGLGDLATTVVIQGDSVRVVGRKVAVPFAASADPLLVIGREAEGGGLRAVVLARSTPGVVADRIGRGLALDAARMSGVTIDVTVPAERLLGGPAFDEGPLRRSLQLLRLLVGSGLAGTAQRAVEYAADYATSRVAFGRPIASFQGVSFPLTEAQMRLEASRLEIADVAAGLTDSVATDQERRVDQAISYAAKVAVAATRSAVQTLGGHGFVTDHPVELWYRSATALAGLDFDPTCSPFEPAL